MMMIGCNFRCTFQGKYPPDVQPTVSKKLEFNSNYGTKFDKNIKIYYVSSMLLPERRNELTYSLRTRQHDRMLSQRVTRLTDNNFIIRQLLKIVISIYSLIIVLSCVLSCSLNEYVMLFQTKAPQLFNPLPINITCDGAPCFIHSRSVAACSTIFVTTCFVSE